MSSSVPHSPQTEISIHREGAMRMGFFTDTTVCIGCKACEVACKQWNDLPSDGNVFRRGGSYDHTGSLNATTWRHVRFIELLEPSPVIREEADRALAAGAGGMMPNLAAAAGGCGGGSGDEEVPDIVAMAQENSNFDLVAAAVDRDRWVFMSNVCKHCTHAGCMDACPTGALIRTEFETVVLQADVCNGCGYCVPACPFGVVARSPEDGRASKCTLCYDRLQDGLEPACAKACPTDSIQFGPYEELVDTAERRVAELHQRGLTGAYLYGAGDAVEDQLAGGLGAFFLLTEQPERYGLPADADSPIQENVVPATLAAMGAALTAATGVAAAMLVERRRSRRSTSSDPIGPLTALAIGAAVFEGGRELRELVRRRRSS
jgi:formate dehydrogenase iron-sulfur subunit